VGKYRLDFPAPVKWRGRTVRLVFAGAMTDTEVWINGQPVGPRHQGAFYEFKYDVTSLLHLGGSNRLEVTVSKESADPSVNEAERRADYWNFGGIFRPVFLEVLPPAFIDRTAIDARADGGFRAEVFLGTAAAAPGRIVARILDGSGAEAAPPVIAAFAAGATSASLTARIASPRLWTAETPVLYRANFTLEDGDRESHGVSERFGFRTFEVRERDGLYLNGRKITLKGVNRHSFWPESARTLSRRLNFDDARLIRAMNMNAVRMSHYPPDRDFLEACDELGLYVLDELGGWHGHYETPVGQKLVGEMVRRDVNHPCILFWDNGNEGGWNTALDAEFAKWDPQPRPVLHPQQKLSGVETMHYRSYAETQDYLGRGDIYLPTEFLHGLYDGGHGAGLWDYWELMRKTPNCAGGFLWVFADEGVSRTDQQGRIDNVGNYAADGIVGPHHEPEGSFETIREVWSPVQAGPARLPADFQGTLAVENRYDFTNLDQCTFSWSLGRFSRPDGTTAGHANVASGELKGPSVPAGAAGELRLPLPADWRSAEVLYVTARDPGGAHSGPGRGTATRQPPEPAPPRSLPSVAKSRPTSPRRNCV
jgi:beta-galactosidase/beta-glucuronidase